LNKTLLVGAKPKGLCLFAKTVTQHLKKNNLPFLIFIVIGLLVALGGFIASEFTDYFEGEYWTLMGLRISEFAGFFMLLANGTFLKTKYFRYFIGLFSIVLIAALFKILHWSHSATLLIIGFIGIKIVYFFSFMNKPIKKRLDYLKLAWVIAAYGIGLLKILNFIGSEYQFLPSAIMWLAIIDYLNSEREQRTLSE
jgi:hypothetical protein